MKDIIALGETYGTRLVLDGPSVVIYWKRDGVEVRHNKWLCRCQCGRIGWVFEKNLHSSCRSCTSGRLMQRRGVGGSNRARTPDAPIHSRPGSEQRILELQQRAMANVALSHPMDLTIANMVIDD